MKDRAGIRTAIAVAGLAAMAGALATGVSLGQQKGAAPLHLEGSAAPDPWTRYRGWNPARWDTYNTLARRDVTPGPGKEIEIGEIAGDAKKGQALAFARTRGGGCLACHVMGTSGQETPGNVAPDLSEIGTLGRTDQWLFNYIYDARVYNPQSSMPPW